MHPTLHRAGSSTHLKIALVSLVAAIAVVVIGFNARVTSFETANGPAVIKAKPAADYAGQQRATVR